MRKFIEMLTEALRWIRLASKLFYIARHCSEELVLLYAVSRAEILAQTDESFIDGDDDKKGAKKKNYVKNYLRKNFLFKNKNIVELDKLVQSTWVYKFHKDK